MQRPSLRARAASPVVRALPFGDAGGGAKSPKQGYLDVWVEEDDQIGIGSTGPRVH